jgi:hypothetical protein
MIMEEISKSKTAEHLWNEGHQKQQDRTRLSVKKKIALLRN